MKEVTSLKTSLEKYQNKYEADK